MVVEGFVFEEGEDSHDDGEEFGEPWEYDYPVCDVGAKARGVIGVHHCAGQGRYERVRRRCYGRDGLEGGRY